MASFSDALQALAQGQLKAEVLLAHVERALARNPRLVETVLAHLTDAYERGLLEAHTSAKLKAHALRTVTALKANRGENAGGRSPGETANPAVSRVRPEDASAPAFDPSSGYVDVGAIDIDLTQIAADAGQTSAGDGGHPLSTLVTVGATLKERFVLDEIVGVGGMGTVYKGRDLLKVEARDKNPYVALKVLNEAFKKHPDAFIALQREASRQQKLAHPNIATVYDFDRSGGTIFLTMEYLEGQPLNSYLRREVRPRGGLPFAEAFPIIRGLGQALGYAHERDIVHSDFKPANCFLTDSGTVKVLDFGIARVIQGQDDSEKTLFDPSSLGALTPAYASPEMLNGEEPDPRDDIYALACVAYELLAGRHPYDRKSASYAREHRLVPAPHPRPLPRPDARAQPGAGADAFGAHALGRRVPGRPARRPEDATCRMDRGRDSHCPADRRGRHARLAARAGRCCSATSGHGAAGMKRTLLTLRATCRDNLVHGPRCYCKLLFLARTAYRQLSRAYKKNRRE